MFSFILAVLLIAAIIVAVFGVFGLVFLLVYLPITSCMDGYTRLPYGEFRVLYAAAPNSWTMGWGSVRYKGRKLYAECYFVGIGQLRYWVWYSKRRLAQRKEENQESRERLFQAIQESKH